MTTRLQIGGSELGWPARLRVWTSGTLAYVQQEWPKSPISGLRYLALTFLNIAVALACFAVGLYDLAILSMGIVIGLAWGARHLSRRPA